MAPAIHLNELHKINCENEWITTCFLVLQWNWYCIDSLLTVWWWWLLLQLVQMCCLSRCWGLGLASFLITYQSANFYSSCLFKLATATLISNLI